MFVTIPFCAGQVVVKGQLDDIDTTLVTRPPEATLFSQLPGNDPVRALERKPLKRHLEDLIEKPPGKGPFTCRICFAIFSGWTGMVNNATFLSLLFTFDGVLEARGHPPSPGQTDAISNQGFYLKRVSPLSLCLEHKN